MQAAARHGDASRSTIMLWDHERIRSGCRTAARSASRLGLVIPSSHSTVREYNSGTPGGGSYWESGSRPPEPYRRALAWCGRAAGARTWRRRLAAAVLDDVQEVRQLERLRQVGAGLDLSGPAMRVLCRRHHADVERDRALPEGGGEAPAIQHRHPH